jgi:hypothetical protein
VCETRQSQSLHRLSTGACRFKAFEDFESEYKQAGDRLEKANAQAYTAPEWCFRVAKKKIDAGHYSFLNEKGEDTEVTPTSK